MRCHKWCGPHFPTAITIISIPNGMNLPVSQRAHQMEEDGVRYSILKTRNALGRRGTIASQPARPTTPSIGCATIQVNIGGCSGGRYRFVMREAKLFVGWGPAPTFTNKSSQKKLC